MGLLSLVIMHSKAVLVNVHKRCNADCLCLKTKFYPNRWWASVAGDSTFWYDLTIVNTKTKQKRCGIWKRKPLGWLKKNIYITNKRSHNNNTPEEALFMQQKKIERAEEFVEYGLQWWRNRWRSDSQTLKKSKEPVPGLTFTLKFSWQFSK